MGRKRPDTDEQAQIILYAEVHGDEAAQKRYKLSARSFRRYRELARDETSELSETVRKYAEVLDPERKATNFAAWLTGQVQSISGLIKEKASAVDGRNPEGLRALNEHAETLLNHAAALAYIGGLFQSDEPAVPDDE